MASSSPGSILPDSMLQRFQERAPVYDRESPTDPDDPDHQDPDSPDDRDIELAQGGIAPEVVHLMLDDGQPCLVGLEACEPMPDRVPIRTFWRQTGVN